MGTLLEILIVILLVYYFAGRKSKLRHRDGQAIDIESVPVEEKVNCPHCGKMVRDDFATCPYCGQALKVKCEQCGREMNRDWRACPYCGIPVKPK
jgi:RNA polymerase subunit RPABC4/transcription elongation factor Spt4